MFTTHMPKLALELSGSPSTGGWLMALVALCSAASMWLTGQWAAKRWGKRVTLIVLHTARAVSFTVLALAPSLPAFILGVVMFGLSSFPVIPLTTGLIGRPLRRHSDGRDLGIILAHPPDIRRPRRLAGRASA